MGKNDDCLAINTFEHVYTFSHGGHQFLTVRGYQVSTSWSLSVEDPQGYGFEVERDGENVWLRVADVHGAPEVADVVAYVVRALEAGDWYVTPNPDQPEHYT